MASSSSAAIGGSSGKRSMTFFWWDPAAGRDALKSRFGSQFDAIGLPGLTTESSPELKACAYIQHGIGHGLHVSEDPKSEVVSTHATNVPANGCPPSWALLPMRGDILCSGKSLEEQWRGCYFNLQLLSDSTDKEKHWRICLFPGCGHMSAGFTNWCSHRNSAHPSWSFFTGTDLQLPASSSVLGRQTQQALFNAAPGKPKAVPKKEIADLLARFKAGQPGVPFAMLGSDSMHRLLEGVAGLAPGKGNAPRAPMVKKAHHSLFEKLEKLTLSNIAALLKDSRLARLQHNQGVPQEDDAVKPVRIAFSTDGGSQNKDNFLQIQLFLMNRGLIHEFALELKVFPHPHTADNYFKVLEGVARKLGDGSAKAFFTSDNCKC
jgi:hypothetical protein